MRKLRIGSTPYIATRPLIHGLAQDTPEDVTVVTADPGRLAEDLESGALDAALIPTIEFLRGVGTHYIGGPALLATGKTGGLIMTTDKDPADLQRIAVHETCRTPLAVLRIVLDRLYGVTPDFCVYKGDPEAWCDGHDAILLSGDLGLAFRYRPGGGADMSAYDLGEMWAELFEAPLVLSLWAYNDEALGDRLTALLTESRDSGIRNLSRLADDLACRTPYDGPFLYDYLSAGWTYHLGEAEAVGIRLLEEQASAYQLIAARRSSALASG